jgi:hypothetical protein
MGENEYASRLRHWALTDSRPSANVTLIILRVADLAAALPDNLFAHPAWRFSIVSNINIRDGYRGQNEFFRSLLDNK